SASRPRPPTTPSSTTSSTSSTPTDPPRPCGRRSASGMRSARARPCRRCRRSCRASPGCAEGPMLAFDFALEDMQQHEVWRGPLPTHALERLIADTHLQGILAGALPNDGGPVRLDACHLETGGARPRLRVEVGTGAASFGRAYVPEQALRDDAEVIVTQ